ncbi:hypothetical protein GCM10028806_40140 [Spirosoma terrae]|uniref:Uncharacterized protein n=1 Tax=Spirosoma terrae TaxID=1968276 RepID=A0A6L9LE73_9BACT|nr:hypothetical protein [Spirosoma terrae]NDU98690.1 hypothetical protein [Spirosoma terrae]
MQEERSDRQWQIIDIPTREFSTRLDEHLTSHASAGTLFSRLAVIHQVAKAYAVEAARQLSPNLQPADVEIEEITDPPMYGYVLDDDPVVIQFSYSQSN